MSVGQPTTVIISGDRYFSPGMIYCSWLIFALDLSLGVTEETLFAV
jgi:hypothetical protein